MSRRWRSYYVHGGSLKLYVFVMVGKSPTAFASLLFTINQKVNNLLKRLRRVVFVRGSKQPPSSARLRAAGALWSACLFVLSQRCIRLFAPFTSYSFTITALSDSCVSFLFWDRAKTRELKWIIYDLFVLSIYLYFEDLYVVGMMAFGTKKVCWMNCVIKFCFLLFTKATQSSIGIVCNVCVWNFDIKQPISLRSRPTTQTFDVALKETGNWSPLE